jgi:tropinone reductase I
VGYHPNAGGTKGIGRAVVEELTALGARVFVCARNAVDVEEATSSLRSSGADVVGAVFDVSVRQQREALMQAVGAAFGGRLNILVNNVGTNIRKRADQFTEQARLLGLLGWL